MMPQRRPGRQSQTVAHPRRREPERMSFRYRLVGTAETITSQRQMAAAGM